MSDSIEHDGIALRLGTRDYVVPPLNFRLLRKLESKFDVLTQIKPPKLTPEQIDAVIDVVHAALSRNYVELARADIEELIDLGNVGRVLQAISGVSGLDSPGEGQAGNRSTGMRSIPTS